jgi:hypothetical protein
MWTVNGAEIEISQSYSLTLMMMGASIVLLKNLLRTIDDNC